MNNKFTQFKKSIKQTSHDIANNKYMCESELIVYDFDLIKDSYVSKLGTREDNAPLSNDALYCDSDKNYYFIEFKNGKVDKYQLMKKNYDSTIILSNYLNEVIDNLRNKLRYILVYNEGKYPNKQDSREEPKHRNQVGVALGKLANKPFVLFGLSFFENYLFSSVETLTVTEFEEKYLRKWEEENSLKDK